jgi:hypothetical protein
VETKTNKNGIEESVDHYIILNEIEIELERDAEGNQILPNGRPGELIANTNYLLKWFIDGDIVNIDAPKGFGVSPFLKVWRILELIFFHYGFTVSSNPFKTHRQLKKLVALNNCYDAIMTGSLNYKDLMPDVTVREFLDVLYAKFGMKWFINSNMQTVDIVFLKDMMTPSANGMIDFTEYKTEEPVISAIRAKQLKLTCNREIDHPEARVTTKTLYATYEEFLDAFRHEFFDDTRGVSLPKGVSNYFSISESIYRVRYEVNKETVESSDFFDWDKKAAMDYEEIKMDDLCLPLRVAPIDKNLMYYKVGIKTVYSDIEVQGKDQEKGSAKLAFAFGWGQTNRDTSKSSKFGYFFASQINRDEYGNFMYDSSGAKYDLSLTINRVDGLFNRFWKEYDAWLRHSGYDVTCKLKLPEREIFNLKMYQTVIINNQPLLPVEIKYKLNKKDSIVECKFKTLRLYRPYDLASEQNIPTYKPQKYWWNYKREEDPPTRAVFDATGVLYYEETGYGFGNIHIVVPDDEGNPIEEYTIPVSQVGLLPPTEEQFQNNDRLVSEYSSTLIRFWDFKRFPITITITYFPDRVIY